MKRLRWQILAVLLALIAIGVLLLNQNPAALLPVEQAIKPATGGIYTEGLVGALGRLNPALDFYNPADRDVDRLIYSSLFRFNARGLPEFDLVESMGISKDGTKYNLTLRSDAVWHDGEPVTTDDVTFTIGLLRDESLPVAEEVRVMWAAVEVEAMDEHTLQFRLPEPYAPFQDYLTFGILPSHLLGDLSGQELVNADFNLAPIGSGAYRFDRPFVENGKITGLTLKRFDRYYGGEAFIDQIIFRYYPDAQSALKAYHSGEVQGISQVGLQVLPAVLREPDLSLYTGRLPELSLVYLNLDDPEVPFLQDANIRRALLTGINRQRLIDRLLQSQAIIADGPIFPGSWAYYDGIERIHYDPDAAVALLKEAGYTFPASGGEVRAKDEQRLSFELLFPDDPEHAALAEGLAQDWAKIGVRARLKPLPYETLVLEHLEPRNYQAALVDLDFSRFPDPDLYPFWHQAQITGGQNYAQWDDRQASEYLEQARLTLDLTERARLYRNFQVRFSSELPALPLYYPVYNYAVASQVQGVSMGPLFDTSDRFGNITKWFLVAERAQVGDAAP